MAPSDVPDTSGALPNSFFNSQMFRIPWLLLSLCSCTFPMVRIPWVLLSISFGTCRGLHPGKPSRAQNGNVRWLRKTFEGNLENLMSRIGEHVSSARTRMGSEELDTEPNRTQEEIRGRWQKPLQGLLRIRGFRSGPTFFRKARDSVHENCPRAQS